MTDIEKSFNLQKSNFVLHLAKIDKYGTFLQFKRKNISIF